MQILKFKGKLTSYDFQVDKIPDTCPMCEKGIQPEHHGGYVQIPEYDRMKRAQAVFRCPRDECGYLFFGLYVQKFRDRFGDEMLFLHGTPLVFHFEDRKFSETINILSPEFAKIYNQALIAENNGLLQICGGGYRRALEFLIKDYLISKEPDEKEKIENTFLGTLIEQKTSDEMKIVAERAAWLGNDESH